MGDPAGSQCHKAIFNVGGTTTTSRSWNIRVTQYACGDYDNSGWPGCLQYHTGTAGNIASFGFPPTITVVTTSVTHLQNQYYDVCIRRASSYCYICYMAQIVGTAATTQATQTSFGVSISGATIATSQVGSDCSYDWLDIHLETLYPMLQLQHQQQQHQLPMSQDFVEGFWPWETPKHQALQPVQQFALVKNHLELA